ncbi:hypothetical protein Tco_1347047 [Tanacetum coccineum]
MRVAVYRSSSGGEDVRGGGGNYNLVMEFLVEDMIDGITGIESNWGCGTLSFIVVVLSVKREFVGGVSRDVGEEYTYVVAPGDDVESRVEWSECECGLEYWVRVVLLVDISSKDDKKCALWDWGGHSGCGLSGMVMVLGDMGH